MHRMSEKFQGNNKNASYAIVADGIQVARKEPQETVADYDILKGDYSKILENIDQLPKEIQEVLGFIFCKSKKTREDQFFLCKIKSVLDASKEFKQRMKYWFYKSVDRVNGQEIPIKCFSFNGEIEKMKKNREKSLPVFVPSARTEENDHFLRVFHEAREECSKKLADLENS